MRLYKMEFYKLYHKKAFFIGTLAVIGLMILYFWFVEVGDEIAVAGQNSYYGYEAVQVNRELTKEFEGAITNEKIDRIVEKYGIPSKLAENMPGWRDGNYLNDFVVRYFTNGSWENGTLPTERYTLEESELGKVCENNGSVPVLSYTKGWNVFVEMLQFGLVLGCVLVIYSVSTVFAEEGQTKMLPLIFTTEEGKRKDIRAKVLASYTLTLLIFVGIVLFDLVICSVVYGLDGFSNVTGIVLGEKMLRMGWQMKFPKYLSILLIFGIQGLLFLCASALCVSAWYKNSFMAVVVSAVSWGIPVLFRMILGGFSAILLYAAPVFLIMQGTVDDVYTVWEIVLVFSLFMGAACTLGGFRKYKAKEA